MSDQTHDLFGDTSGTPKGKRKKAKSAQVFKPYNQSQGTMLPPHLEELIPEKHMVRVVNETIEKLNIEPLIATYKGDGTSAYHPLMMLKVLIYAYVSKIYSSRQIAKALQENVHFMWLAGMQRPDFRTINTFRSGRLKEVIEQVFGSMVLFLLENGYIDLQQYFVDGTKLRADSNKHKVVWAKNTKRYKERAQQKIGAILKEIDRVNRQEQERYGDDDLPEQGGHTQLSSQNVKEQIDSLNEIVKNVSPSKAYTRGVKEIQTKLLHKLEKYEMQEQTLHGRNSYAITDPDATVFLTKDQQILPSYNVLIGTQRQFILNYSLHQQRASESNAFIPHMDRFFRSQGVWPSLVMADAAYGSEENYAFLAERQVGSYLKYSTYDRERSKKFRTNPYRRENFPYDGRTDTYLCPQGRQLVLRQITNKATATGYGTSARIYRCLDCGGCPVAADCKRGAGNRSILINPVLDAYRAQARQNLDSDRGIALRKQRGMDVEPPFGDIKFNQGYTRCRLRSEPKVNVEIGLLSMAHNTKKIARWIN